VNAAEAGKIEFERGMSSAPVLTIALIGFNAAIFFITVSQGLLQSESAILNAGALSRELVFHGEVWRLFTAMFLHGGIEHLASNGIGLFIVGMAAEHAYGKLEMIVIYTISGLCGSALSVLMNPGPSLGASGAIFGLLGATIVVFLKYRDRLHLRDKHVGNGLLLWAAYSIATAFFIPFVDNAAHIGGLLGGALCGYCLTPKLISSAAAQ
jgi:rhomboid protease GluP